MEGRLVALDHEVVMAPAFTDVLADYSLTIHRAVRDHTAFQHHTQEKSQGRIVLAGLGVDTNLAQRASAPLAQMRSQSTARSEDWSVWNCTFPAKVTAKSGVSVSSSRQRVHQSRSSRSKCVGECNVYSLRSAISWADGG